jgi:hypothetical protein
MPFYPIDYVNTVFVGVFSVSTIVNTIGIAITMLNLLANSSNSGASPFGQGFPGENTDFFRQIKPR